MRDVLAMPMLWPFGLVTALVTGSTIVSWPLAGALSDRFGRRKPVFLVSQAMSVVVCLVSP
jgi:MFS family permease